MTPSVPMRDKGTATLGMTVDRTVRRNRNTTRITSEMEIASVISTSRTDSRMVVVRSCSTASFTVGGIDACSCGITARTSSTVWMMFAPGWRKMMMSTAGLPLARPALRTSSTESVTCATSDSRSAAPLWYERTSGRYWSAFSNWSVVVRDQSRAAFAMSPFGRLALAEVSAARTSSRLSPRSLSAVGSTSTRTAGSAPPPTLTCPTPLTCESFCCRIDDPMSYIRALSTMSEVSDRSRIGASAGLTLR